MARVVDLTGAGHLYAAGFLFARDHRSVCVILRARTDSRFKGTALATVDATVDESPQFSSSIIPRT